MSIILNHNYNIGLKNAKPTFYKHIIPKGVLSSQSSESSILIPPINTNIDFSMLNYLKI